LNGRDRAQRQGCQMGHDQSEIAGVFHTNNSSKTPTTESQSVCDG
jgi:hypothetical protein